jgi:hypothetical protein
VGYGTFFTTITGDIPMKIKILVRAGSLPVKAR